MHREIYFEAMQEQGMNRDEVMELMEVSPVEDYDFSGADDSLVYANER